MPRPNAIQAAQKFRQDLLNNEAAAAERMGRVYAGIYQRLENDLLKLAEQIAAMPDIDKAAVKELRQAQWVLQQIEEQVTKFGGVVQSEVINAQAVALEAGIDNAVKLIELSLPDLPPNVRNGIIGQLNRIHPDAIEAAAGLLGPDSPLLSKLEQDYGAAVAQQVETHLLDGIASGFNPNRIALLLSKNVQSGLGFGLTQAISTVRTAQIKSYQIANHSMYAANNRLVPEWVWWSALDSRCCMSCIHQHGSVHPYTEVLNDHHQGRCAPIPKTITYKALGLDLPETTQPIFRGEDWFNKQATATQREMMGPGMYEAWKGGKFGFGDLSKKYDSEVYGELLRQATLKELVRQ